MKPKDLSRDPALRTVSSEALLVDGSDETYRGMIHTLMAIGNSFEVLREGFAKVIGISGPQHELLMLIYRYKDGAGLGVGELAALVRLTSAFVAVETNKLSALGLIEKAPGEVDRRRVILKVTEFGRVKLALLSGYQRQINDTLFSCFESRDFLKFKRFLDQILPCSTRAEHLLEELLGALVRRTAAAEETKAASGTSRRSLRGR